MFKCVLGSLVAVLDVGECAQLNCLACRTRQKPDTYIAVAKIVSKPPDMRPPNIVRMSSRICLANFTIFSQ